MKCAVVLSGIVADCRAVEEASLLSVSKQTVEEEDLCIKPLRAITHLRNRKGVLETTPVQFCSVCLTRTLLDLLGL